MVPLSVPGMHSWGNFSLQLLGALGLSPWHGEIGGAFFVEQLRGSRYPIVHRMRRGRVQSVCAEVTKENAAPCDPRLS
jgi:hypothetical protein